MKRFILIQTKAIVFVASCVVLLILATVFDYALSQPNAYQALTIEQLDAMVPAVDKDNRIIITVTPEVIAEVNRIYQSAGMRLYMQGILKRMQTYAPYIRPALVKNQVPLSFMAIPLIESGYKPVRGSISGLWQITASTAQHLGLVVNGQRNDRLNPSLDTDAAIAYLKELNIQYHDWNLVLVAYNIGPIKTNELIKTTGSDDMWILAHSPKAPAQLKLFLAKFSAAVIIMNNPSLVK